jgi:hypothetical protein
MSKDGLVELILFDPLGQEIKKLLLEERTAGLHKLELELDNLTSGVYYYQLRINDFVETKKMILVK